MAGPSWSRLGPDGGLHQPAPGLVAGALSAEGQPAAGGSAALRRLVGSPQAARVQRSRPGVRPPVQAGSGGSATSGVGATTAGGTGARSFATGGPFATGPFAAGGPSGQGRRPGASLVPGGGLAGRAGAATPGRSGSPTTGSAPIRRSLSNGVPPAGGSAVSTWSASEIAAATAGLLSTPPVLPPRGLPAGPPRAAAGLAEDGLSPAARPAGTPAGPGGQRGSGVVAPPAGSAPAAPDSAVGPQPVIRRSLVEAVPAGLFHRLSTPATPGLVSQTGHGPGEHMEIRRTPQTPVPNSQARSVAESLTRQEWDELVDLVVQRIEDRVADELSRRGRRHPGGIF